jgi:hypothetical protein
MAHECGSTGALGLLLQLHTTALPSWPRRSCMEYAVARDYRLHALASPLQARHQQPATSTSSNQQQQQRPRSQRVPGIDEAPQQPLAAAALAQAGCGSSNAAGRAGGQGAAACTTRCCSPVGPG